MSAVRLVLRADGYRHGRDRWRPGGDRRRPARDSRIGAGRYIVLNTQYWRMSDSADATDGSDAGKSERERIRERKLRELREEVARDGEIGGRDSSDAADASPAPSEPIEVDGPEAFQRLVNDHDVVLVDCYADWCGPCQMMEPTVEALATDTDAAVAKVDVDANPGIAQQLGARSIPTLLVYADGEAVDRFMGAQDRATLESAIERAA